jgi:protein-S-isoprenylcysteine O-methyltransferase Ste14
MAWLGRYAPSFLAFAAFAILHSWGAREPAKQLLARWTSPFFVEHFWRLCYCVLSYATLYHGVAPLHWGRNPDGDVWLVGYPEWSWSVLAAVRLGAVALIYAAFLQNDYLEFLGVRQAVRGLGILLGRRPAPRDLHLFGTHRLVVTGAYGWVRHPMMVGGLLFLLTSPPTPNNLVYIAMYTTYMLVGGHYEERRLARVFGAPYRRYQARVGAFVPRWPWRRTGAVP